MRSSERQLANAASSALVVAGAIGAIAVRADNGAAAAAASASLLRLCADEV